MDGCQCVCVCVTVALAVFLGKNVFGFFSAAQIRVQYTKWDEITQRRLSKQFRITPKSKSKLPCLYVFPRYLE